jgi:hypothetical protein
MRDVASGVAELKYWAERDPNLVGVYISPQAPGGKLLDSPDLYPLYDAAQSLDLPLLAHGGTARPPYGPGSRDLDGAWFLLHGFSNPWAGMAAMIGKPINVIHHSDQGTQYTSLAFGGRCREARPRSGSPFVGREHTAGRPLNRDSL